MLLANVGDTIPAAITTAVGAKWLDLWKHWHQKQDSAGTGQIKYAAVYRGATLGRQTLPLKKKLVPLFLTRENIVDDRTDNDKNDAGSAAGTSPLPDDVSTAGMRTL